MRATPARRTARRVLTAVRQRDAWAREIAPGIIDAAQLDPREAASAYRLAYGVVSTQGVLDEALDAAADRPTRMEARVRDALRVASYELLFTDTPSSAAVDQGVELVREVRREAAGFANGVLRAIDARRSSFPWGDPDTDVAALARLHGHPTWIASLLLERFGPSLAGEIMSANNLPAPLYVAVNPFRSSDDAVFDILAGEQAEPQRCDLPGCIKVANARAGVRSSVLERGSAVVADASAQLASSLVPTSDQGRVLEVGAGRGTKSLLLQASARRRGHRIELLAVDSHEFKVELLARRMEDLGVPHVRAVRVDATDALALAVVAGPEVDAVLVDAPCSGLGTLRRHPEQRWRLAPTDVEALSRLGRLMLATAASLVTPSGFVVYSTCTLSKQENEDVVDAFLGSEEGRGFDRTPLGDELPAGWARFLTAKGDFQSVPETDGPDGHYVARLRRR